MDPDQRAQLENERTELELFARSIEYKHPHEAEIARGVARHLAAYIERRDEEE